MTSEGKWKRVCYIKSLSYWKKSKTRFQDLLTLFPIRSVHKANKTWNDESKVTFGESGSFKTAIFSIKMFYAVSQSFIVFFLTFLLSDWKRQHYCRSSQAWGISYFLCGNISRSIFSSSSLVSSVSLMYQVDNKSLEQWS